MSALLPSSKPKQPRLKKNGEPWGAQTITCAECGDKAPREDSKRIGFYQYCGECVGNAMARKCRQAKESMAKRAS